jgi:hypothetical protein
MGAITIGSCSGNKLKLYDDARSTHMQVLGISGQGKSFFWSRQSEKIFSMAMGYVSSIPMGRCMTIC